MWSAIQPRDPGDLWSRKCGYWHGKYQRCIQIPHPEDEAHRFVSAAAYQWDQAGGFRPPGWVLRPKDGDWRNLDWQNWETIPKKQQIVEAFARPANRVKRGWTKVDGVWNKTCTECGKTEPVEYFPIQRNQCADCFAELNRERRRASYEAHAAQGCVVFGGKHYHVGKRGARKTPQQQAALSELLVRRGLRSRAFEEATSARDQAMASRP